MKQSKKAQQLKFSHSLNLSVILILIKLIYILARRICSYRITDLGKKHDPNSKSLRLRANP